MFFSLIRSAWYLSCNIEVRACICQLNNIMLMSNICYSHFMGASFNHFNRKFLGYSPGEREQVSVLLVVEFWCGDYVNTGSF